MRQSKKLLESLREDWASPPRFKDTLVQGVGRVDFDLRSVCIPDSSLHPSFHSPTPLTAAGGYWGAWEHGCRDFSRLATGPFPIEPMQASAPSSALSYPHMWEQGAVWKRPTSRVRRLSRSMYLPVTTTLEKSLKLFNPVSSF